MKITMDDRVKHRLTGLVVVLSIAVIFLPAMMKTSNRHFEESLNISLKLPSRPALPKVSIPDQQAMFKSVHVAKIDVPQHIEITRPSVIAKAESLSKIPVPQIARVEPQVNSLTTAKVTLPIKATVALQKKDRDIYAVQLASFIQQRNAQDLVIKLRQKGYAASYDNTRHKQGQAYKVIVGKMAQKNEAIMLQKKLASNMQLSGFVIKTGVS